VTFEAQETSQDAGQPIELYEFNQAGETFRFTNSSIDRVYNAQTWLAIAGLDRTQPVRKVDETGLQVKVSMSIHDPTSQGFARRWVSAGPETETTIEIFQVHLTDAANELYSLFQGQVRSPKYNNDKVEFLCGSLDVVFEAQGPRTSWGAMCSHQHFDAKCTVVEAAFSYNVVVTAVDADGVTFTAAGLDANVQVDLIQGRLRESVFQVRQIIARPGADQVTVKYPFTSPPTVGQSVTFIEGCRHDLPACVSYANVINFGGVPWTINRNPFTHSRGVESQGTT
jgi:hypothetical protein